MGRRFTGVGFANLPIPPVFEWTSAQSLLLFQHLGSRRRPRMRPWAFETSTRMPRPSVRSTTSCSRRRRAFSSTIPSCFRCRAKWSAIAKSWPAFERFLKIAAVTRWLTSERAISFTDTRARSPERMLSEMNLSQRLTTSASPATTRASGPYCKGPTGSETSPWTAPFAMPSSGLGKASPTLTSADPPGRTSFERSRCTAHPLLPGRVAEYVGAKFMAGDPRVALYLQRQARWNRARALDPLVNGLRGHAQVPRDGGLGLLVSINGGCDCAHE